MGSTVRQPARRVRDLLPDAPAGAVALTLDDGPHPTWTPRMLDVLRTHQVLATFCLVGDQARAHPALVRAILGAGHSVCNHTMTHPQPFSRRPRAQMRAEISRAQEAIVAAGGRSPRLFRAPGGDWSPDVLATADELGLIPLGWDVDPRDWSRPGEEAIVRALSVARAGDILLSHDGGGDRSQTVAALDRVLPALRARGCVFVAL
ncbi:polysaccharide deacetylase family protein [Frankia sp. AgB32]|uniref:polysaccharide deacetylase family protein n=1 Tax=Frankia sp. AgB32 TaxID=631119 RepID=UPI00200F20F9|nr:polysaccharide deacetylase family protein [Frankia sp. AgB32]MCK9897521.1 polysaccharide deacetylase family protein [Frankia sp. AgB32]